MTLSTGSRFSDVDISSTDDVSPHHTVTSPSEGDLSVVADVDSSSSTLVTEQYDQDANSDMESIGGQRNVDLSRKTMLISMTSLSICLFVAFLDQTSVSTATPALAGDLKTGTSTSWIGTSFLISSTAFQLINGRLSDIFGRKNMLLICLFLMGIGDLACGFAKTPMQLYALRAIAGIGGGGVNSIVMIIISDITSLQNRGYYQGLTGAISGLAGIGPFLGGVIVQSASWRWVFWMMPIITLPTAGIIWFYLPLKHQSGGYMDSVKKIDYGGAVLNIASTVLLLVSISGGGVSYAWTSAFFISTIVISIVLTALFVLYEWKIAKLPIMPLRLYRDPHCWALYLQSFLMGIAYFGNFFYLPLYFQCVLGYNALAAGAIILPLVIPIAAAPVLSGQYMSGVGSYMHCILVGFAVWTLGNGLTLLFDGNTKLGPLICILIVDGIGVGLTLQPVLMGMYANGRSGDRAVITGLRNFIRTIGGAFGVVIPGVILSNTLEKQLGGKGIVPDDIIGQLTSSTYSLDSMGLSQDGQDRVLEAYMQGLYFVFVFFTVCTALSLFLTFWVGNKNLKTSPIAESASSLSNDESSADESRPEDRCSSQMDIEKGRRTAE
ncbi:major facilitator superfamily transporter [Fusarium heterosporum]|uniref:Major facilitator superfamily transporter n=1 Tax=Fusarium heterosporum TaxID=42747 RepID=A0A8H5TJF3_FUSHE|nr:major facilitator superfamily transporter [Fusarium heterosporum]